MNRKYRIFIVVLALLLCLAGCKENMQVPSNTAEMVETVSTTNASVPQETILGDGVIAGVELEEEEETEPFTQEKEGEIKETTSSAEDEIRETTTPAENGKVEETPATTSPEEDSLSYIDYMNMSADEQAVFIASFESMDAFMAWFNDAKAEYDSTDGSIDIGSGSVDLEDIFGGNP